MPRADVLDLAASLGGPEVDPLQLDDFYDDSILALQDVQLLIDLTMQTVTSGQATYPFPSTAARVIAAFYDDSELTRTTMHSLESLSRDWRTIVGTPYSFIEEHEPQRVVRLFPAPDTTSPAAMAFPEPFGEDYPAGQLVLLTTNRIDAPPWLDYPLAMSVLVREFERQSAHRDTTFAELCTRIAALFRKLGGQP